MRYEKGQQVIIKRDSGVPYGRHCIPLGAKVTIHKQLMKGWSVLYRGSTFGTSESDIGPSQTRFAQFQQKIGG